MVTYFVMLLSLFIIVLALIVMVVADIKNCDELFYYASLIVVACIGIIGIQAAIAK